MDSQRMPGNMVRVVTGIAVMFLLAVPAMAEPGVGSAQILQRCLNLQKALPKQQKALLAQTETRDALAEAAEDRGDAFEDAAAMVAFSPEGRARADEAKRAFDQARADIEAADQALALGTDAFNRDVSWFNAHCAR
jgi:hypothetical protein